MISARPKRLIEVDLPIKHLSALRNRRSLPEDIDARRLGLWWSRKPQHQSRAVWLALLLPDPADERTSAREAERLREILRRYSYLSDGGEATLTGLRENMLRFCCELAEPSQIVTERAKKALSDLGELFGFNNQIALDAFAGGGSIPVEAERLGLATIANEYNPIASLYLRALLEWGKRLSTSQLDSFISALGTAIDETCGSNPELFPKHPILGQPIGYVRFRRLVCEGPNCGRIVPATSKFELDQRNKIGIVFSREGNDQEELALKIAASPPDGFPQPTIRAGALTCPITRCGYTTPRKSIAKQWARYKLTPQLVAVVYRDQEDSLKLLDPLPSQCQAVSHAVEGLANTDLEEYIPEEHWPATEPRRFSPPLYGYSKFADCHTERQVLFLAKLCKTMTNINLDAPSEIAKGMAALVIAQGVDRHSSFCRWRNDRGGSHENTFAGKSLGMIWDFFEADPLHSENSLKHFLNELRTCIISAKSNLVGEGTVLQLPTQDLILPDESVDFLYTDPPYYDQIPYSHLSDWPFVWMRRVGAFVGLAGPDGLVPKDREVAVDRPHSQSPSTHNETYFKEELRKAFVRVQSCMKNDGVGVVVFAHQKTSAWESLLQGLLDAGFCVTASWPLETERGGRLQAQGTASLQSSIHLVIRPRKSSKSIGEWRDVLSKLPGRIHEWMPRLAKEGIVGADAIFACLGPALEIFSSYSRVEKASGETVSLNEYLEHVWAAVAKEALALVFEGADASGLEEDARLTAMWLWTLSTGRNGDNSASLEEVDEEEGESEARSTIPRGFVLEYDAARKIAQGLGAHLEALASLVEVKGDVARLMAVSERTRALFGNEEPDATVSKPKKTSQLQLDFVAELEQAEETGGWGGKGVAAHGATVLDRIHQSMILFAAGRSEALRRFLVDEGAGRNERFWRLGQVLSYLYPKASDEKRWIDGVLARKKGLGF